MRISKDILLGRTPRWRQLELGKRISRLPATTRRLPRFSACFAKPCKGRIGKTAGIVAGNSSKDWAYMGVVVSIDSTHVPRMILGSKPAEPQLRMQGRSMRPRQLGFSLGLGRTAAIAAFLHQQAGRLCVYCLSTSKGTDLGHIVVTHTGLACSESSDLNNALPVPVGHSHQYSDYHHLD